MRDKEPIVKIPYLLDQILNQNLFTRTEPKEIDMAAEIERIFGRQVDFLKLSPNNGVYYDVEHVYPRRKYLLNQIKYFIHKWIR